jgi:hypothetical protein
MITKQRGEHYNGSRYFYDQKLIGWCQVDTCEDASYYGNWANINTLELFSYAEGDTCHTRCETVEEFVSEIRDFLDFCKRAGMKFYGIDPGPNHTPEIMKPWIDAGLDHLIH